MTKKRLALFLSNDTNEFQVSIRDEARSTCEKLGHQLEISLAQGDAIVQIRQIYACINRDAQQRPDALLLIPVRDATLEHMIRDAIRAEMACVILNRHPTYMTALRAEFPRVPLGTVGPDQVEAGRLQARLARALLPTGGFVLYVLGPSLSTATEDRQTGFKEELNGGGIDVAQVHGDWSSDIAEKAVARWLHLVLQSELRLDLVVAQNDNMAIGAKKALSAAAKELGRPELATIPLVGFDGHPTFGRKLVDSGELAATVIQRSPGGPAVEWITRALDGIVGPPQVTLPLTTHPELGRLRPRKS